MPIEVGTEAPDFVLRTRTTRRYGSRTSAGSNVLLVFYPLAFTGTCQGELCAVRDNLNDFVNDAVQVLTVSVDSSPAHKVWAEREGYQFPLLADFWPHGAVARRTASSTRSAATPTGARSSSTRRASSASPRRPARAGP